MPVGILTIFTVHSLVWFFASLPIPLKWFSALSIKHSPENLLQALIQDL